MLVVVAVEALVVIHLEHLRVHPFKIYLPHILFCDISAYSLPHRKAARQSSNYE